MLEFIITFTTGVTKDATLPDIVKLNFPSKKDLLQNLKPQSVRDEHLLRFHPQVPDPVKVLPLLGHTGTDDGFRQCFAENPQSDYADYFDDFCEEMAQSLEECGYEELYERNPYDWIFLWASTTEQPLESFRGVMKAIDFDDLEN